MLLAGGARVGRAVPVGGASGEGVAGVVGMNCPPGRADVPTFMRTNGAFEGFVVGCASFGTCVEPVCCARELGWLNSWFYAWPDLHMLKFGNPGRPPCPHPPLPTYLPTLLMVNYKKDSKLKKKSFPTVKVGYYTN